MARLSDRSHEAEAKASLKWAKSRMSQTRSQGDLIMGRLKAG